MALGLETIKQRHTIYSITAHDLVQTLTSRSRVIASRRRKKSASSVPNRQEKPIDKIGEFSFDAFGDIYPILTAFMMTTPHAR
ncbi:hypothetical protein ACE41H_24470 [Paenibacillus enshidis]|uniref:Uncharacterized protein n=1 Tax=Paenibacillus enshidis TaxID=1458439 RepID=A0ABV5B0B9_9BACL